MATTSWQTIILQEYFMVTRFLPCICMVYHSNYATMVPDGNHGTNHGYGMKLHANYDTTMIFQRDIMLSTRLQGETMVLHYATWFY